MNSNAVNWTPARDAQLRQHFAEGYPQREIAGLMALTESMISHRCKRLGLQRETAWHMKPPADAGGIRPPGPDAPLEEIRAFMTKRRGMPWSLGQRDWLRDRIAEGLSVNEIAAKAGISRNAVLGFGWRNGLSVTGGWKNRQADPTPPKPKPVERQTLSGRTCAWPMGDPMADGFHYCGDPVEEGRPYCPDHCARAYRKPGEPYQKADT